MSAPQRLAVAFLPCTYCGVARGEWCIRRTSGKRADWVHEDRVRPLRLAFWEGYEQGTNEILDALIDGEPWVTAMTNRRQERRDQEATS